MLVDGHHERLRRSNLQIYNPEEYLINLNAHLELKNRGILLYIGTGGTEESVAEFVRKSRISSPIILLSHLNNNSLPASMEIRTYLEKNGYKSRIVHDSLENLIERLKSWGTLANHLENIRNFRIGVFGKPSSWLIASEVDFKAIREFWGINFIEYDLSLLELENGTSDDLELSTAFQKNATEQLIPSKKVDEASRVATLLLNHIRSEKLDGVTVQCFDYLVKNEISGCLALCYANDQDGIIAGCEGDIPSTVTMLIAKELTGTPSFMANVTVVDTENNTVVFAHCTVPTTIVKDYDLLTHFETNLSVGVRGRFEPQEITVLKVFGDDLSQYWVSSGEILENLENPDGCRTQIRVRLDEDVNYFLERSFANHHIVIPGDHRKMIEEFFSFVSLTM